MGKRSRKRQDGPVRTAPRPAPQPPPRRSNRPGVGGRVDRFIERAEHRPKAPWHPFPLVELSVLAGIVLIVVGALNADTDNGKLTVVIGTVLAALGGLDTAVRDHFSGFKSHTTLLAGFPTALLAAAIGYTGLPIFAILIIAVGVFLTSFFLLRSAFKTRTGKAFRF